MDSLFEIQCFGNLDVKINGQRVQWERLKAKELFGYLLTHHNQGVHKEKLLDVLWPEHDPQKALLILQTTVYNLRKLFSTTNQKVKIKYSSGQYSLSITGSVCDLFFVESILNTVDDEETDLILVERATKLLNAGLFRNDGYLWAAEKEEKLRAELCKTLKKVSRSFLSSENWSRAILPLRLFLETTPYDEEANNQLLHCYSRLNDGAGIIDHYNWLKQTLQKDYDMAPAVSTRKLYQNLFQEKYG